MGTTSSNTMQSLGKIAQCTPAVGACSSLTGHWVSEDTGPRICHITSRLLQLGPGSFTDDNHGQAPTGRELCCTSDLLLLHDDLHWLDVPQRVQYKLAVMVHRCLGRRAPSYLADYCVPVSTVPGRQHLRSASRRHHSTRPSQHFWRSCFRHCGHNSLEFSVWQFTWSSCWAWSASTWLENASVWVTLRLV